VRRTKENLIHLLRAACFICCVLLPKVCPVRHLIQPAIRGERRQQRMNITTAGALPHKLAMTE